MEQPKGWNSYRDSVNAAEERVPLASSTCLQRISTTESTQPPESRKSAGGWSPKIEIRKKRKSAEEEDARKTRTMKYHETKSCANGLSCPNAGWLVALLRPWQKKVLANKDTVRECHRNVTEHHKRSLGELKACPGSFGTLL